jgi:hypothetical protein
MANPAAVTTAAATSEGTNSFLPFKIQAFESSHLNLIVSPSKMALTSTMDLQPWSRMDVGAARHAP